MNKNISANYEMLFVIAQRAITLHAAEERVRATKKILSEAYFRAKAAEGIDYAEKNSPEWEKIARLTDAEYDAYHSALRFKGVAKRRLATAVRAHLSGGA